MRTRIDDYTFASGTRSINTGVSDLTIEDIRLVMNETQKVPIASSMKKDNIVSIASGVVTYADAIPALAEGDKLTVEIDQGKTEQVLIAMTEAEVTEMVNDIIS